MRLIDAIRIEQYILNNCSDNEEINAIYAEIINAPTVDAIEVVRCKDCKHYRTRWYGFCELIENENIYREDNDFCSRGERREDEVTK